MYGTRVYAGPEAQIHIRDKKTPNPEQLKSIPKDKP
jgi:hypothetical protein